MQIGPPPCALPSKPRQGAGEGSHALGPGSAAPAGGRGRHSPQPRRPPGRRKRQAAQEAAEAVRPVRWPAAASPRGPVGMRTPGQTQGPVLAQPAAPVSPSERLKALHPAPSAPGPAAPCLPHPPRGHSQGGPPIQPLCPGLSCPLDGGADMVPSPRSPLRLLPVWPRGPLSAQGRGLGTRPGPSARLGQRSA